MTTTGNPDTESAFDDLGRLRVDVCKRLGARRRAYTDDQLANLFEIHRSYLYRLYNGKSTVSLPMAVRMAKKLHTKVEKLFVCEVDA